MKNFFLSFTVVGAFVALIGVGVGGTALFLLHNRQDAQFSRLADEVRVRLDDLEARVRRSELLARSSSTAQLGQDNGRSKELVELDKKIQELEKQRAKVVKVPAVIAGPQQSSTPAMASREDQLTGAVARAAPAVVSIVISKDVPQLEVVCQNPFGDDPFFQDVDICIRTFRQKGVQKKRTGAGTGFLISKDGHIITNKHVVFDEKAEYIVLLSTGEQKKADIVYKDAQHDVAVLKIDGGGHPFIRFGDSSSLKLGQTVIAIGNALGEYNNSVSVGIISGLNRSLKAASPSREIVELSGVIQTDAAINPGNSGGPLLTLDGAAIGVNVATVLGSNSISFSIPTETVRALITDVLPGV